MGWARMDDSRADHPKLLAAGLAARGLDEACIEWCSRHGTDGTIPRSAVAMLAAGHGTTAYKKLADRLVEVGRWEATDDGWSIHDFLQYNPSAAEVAAKREATKERVKRHRNGPSNALPHPTTERVTNAVHNTPPDPTRPDPLLNTPPPLTSVGPATRQAALVEKVLEAVARRQMVGVTITSSESGWLAKARSTLAAKWTEHIIEHAALGFDALVDQIEPPPPPPKPDPNSARTTEDGRTFLPGTGWIEAPKKDADCVHCHGTGVAKGYGEPEVPCGFCNRVGAGA